MYSHVILRHSVGETVPPPYLPVSAFAATASGPHFSNGHEVTYRGYSRVLPFAAIAYPAHGHNHVDMRIELQLGRECTQSGNDTEGYPLFPKIHLHDIGTLVYYPLS